MLIDNETNGTNYINKFNKIYNKTKANEELKKIFFEEDLKYIEQNLARKLPRISTMMDNMIWMMEHPDLFDNQPLFQHNIQFSHTYDNNTLEHVKTTLTVGRNPLYLQLDKDGYHLYQRDGYLRFDKIESKHFPEMDGKIRFYWDTSHKYPEDKHKSASQLRGEALAMFDKHFIDWEEDINYTITKSLEALEAENFKTTQIQITRAEEVDIHKINENIITATLLCEVTNGCLYYKTPHLKCTANLTYDTNTDILTMSDVTVGDSKLKDNDAQYIINEFKQLRVTDKLKLTDVFKKRMIENIENEVEKDER